MLLTNRILNYDDIIDSFFMIRLIRSSLLHLYIIILIIIIYNYEWPQPRQVIVKSPLRGQPKSNIDKWQNEITSPKVMLQ